MTVGDLHFRSARVVPSVETADHFVRPRLQTITTVALCARLETGIV